MNENEIIIYPFTDDFLCPHCCTLDNGSYCSNCSKELIIRDEDYISNLKIRLLRLSYFSFEEWKSEFSHIYKNYSFEVWENKPIEIVCRTDEGQNGLVIQFIVITNINEISENEILAVIDLQLLAFS